MSNLCFFRICENCGKAFFTDCPHKFFCCEKCAEHSYDQKIARKGLYLALLHPKAPDKEYLTVDETAQILGLSKKNVYNKIREGKLYGISLPGHSKMVKRDWVERYRLRKNVEQYYSSMEVCTIEDIMRMSGMGKTSCYAFIKRHDIRKYPYCRFVRYSQRDVISALADCRFAYKHWLTFEGASELLGKDEFETKFFLVNYRISHKKVKQVDLYLKEDIMQAMVNKYRMRNIESSSSESVEDE